MNTMKVRHFVWGSTILLLVIAWMTFAAHLSFAQPAFPAAGTVTVNANLRAGPGTTFGIVGRARQGETVQVADCNTPCDWYELEDGVWIAAFLVDLVPVPLESVANEQPITVIGWNTELNDADVAVIAARMAAFQDVDLWGLSEVNRTTYASTLEIAAEDGEDADYTALLGTSGGGDRLLAIYDATRFVLLDSWELDAINTTGNARAPLVLHLREKTSGEELLFMVNHLYRSRDDERHKQAQLLNAWAAAQTVPVIAVGDYNFDWELTNGAQNHDLGYDLMTNRGVFAWVEPATLVTTQCSGWPCQFNSVLDFVFTAGAAQRWRAEAEIVVVAGDFPDDNTTSDHRPVLARFWPDQSTVTPVVASPTPTRVPPTSVPTGTTANRNANLRAGPGTAYPVAGSAQQGQVLRITGRNTAGDWYQLADGNWIAAFLVGNAPATVPLAEVPALPTLVPPTATPPSAQPTAPPAPTGSANVVIQTIYYDGQVYRVESDEYVVIANIGTAPINIGGWRINAGDPGQDFRFPSVELASGQSIRVYTNEQHPESGGYSFGRGQAIWNNKGDCGYLFDAGGTVISQRCY